METIKNGCKYKGTHIVCDHNFKEKQQKFKRALYLVAKGLPTWRSGLLQAEARAVKDNYDTMKEMNRS